jgi:hypothetical protein
MWRRFQHGVAIIGSNGSADGIPYRIASKNSCRVHSFVPSVSYQQAVTEEFDLIHRSTGFHLKRECETQRELSRKKIWDDFPPAWLVLAQSDRASRKSVWCLHHNKAVKWRM